ncbi:MAG: hypothetical protein FWE23_00240 [Chitinivibrionia bacterium]|nr:hypothetical protein [Chitinivibrionia bacterium]
MRFNCKNIILLLLLNISFLFATFPEQSVVSPYIIKGFSISFSAGYTFPSNRLGLSHAYTEVIPGDSTFFEMINVGLTQLRPGGFFNFGYNRFEWGFFTLAIPPATFAPFADSPMDKFIINFRIYERGDGVKLFDNSAMSLFGGISRLNFFTGAATSQVYFGASLGTRIRRKSNNVCELFFSPSLNFVRYIYDNLNPSYNGDYIVPPIVEIIAQTVEISVPVASRVISGAVGGKSQRFSFTGGITPTLVIANDALKKDLEPKNDIVFSISDDFRERSRSYITDKWFESSRVRVSAFAQIGVHFGNSTIPERRKERKMENRDEIILQRELKQKRAIERRERREQRRQEWKLNQEEEDLL